MGRLPRLVSWPKALSGGSSMLGEVARRGEAENAEPVSETRDGAPSTLSALDPSETAGDGSGPSNPLLTEKLDGCVIVKARGAAGLAKESD